MSRININKYKLKLHEIKETIESDTINLKLLCDNYNFFKNNNLDLKIRHEEFYNNEISPIMEKIKEIQRDKRKELVDKLRDSITSGTEKKKRV